MVPLNNKLIIKMCFHLKVTKESQLSKAVRLGDLQLVNEIKSKIIPETDLPLFHTSGFSHPKLLIYTNDTVNPFEVAFWGLIPNWIKDHEAAKKIWNNTLNARSETIFEKPSFKDAVLNKRCIIYVDGFYEFHHINNKKYPYYIFRKNKKPLALAGLWSKWNDVEKNRTIKSFSIITMKGNAFMSKIHNNPKLKEPRMPLFLEEEQEELWLNSKYSISLETINLLKEKAENIELDAYTVNALMGKNYLGNIMQTTEEVVYQELNNKQTLF